MESFDLVIRGGSIIDGTGAPIFDADVAVKGGVIVAIGTFEGQGIEEIDATGKVVTPGFVDVHTHYDGQITWEHTLTPSSNHGVTTVVMGNCGVGFAPTRKGDQHLAVKLMEGVEDIPEVVMTEGLPWNWETFPEYLDALDQRQGDIDFATQLPHSPLRVYVMGQRGADREPPTTEDLAEMQRLTTEAINAGALGVSTSRALLHRFRSGELAPSVKTERDELLALAAGLKEAGSGVFQLIPNVTEGDAASELNLFRDLVGASGRPLNFSLADSMDQPLNWATYVDGLQQMHAENLPICGQFLPRPMGLLFGLDLSFHPFSLNPSYRSIANLPLHEKVERMRDPDLRARLIAEEPEDPNPYFVLIINSAFKLYALNDPVIYNFNAEDELYAQAKRLGIPEREYIYDELLKDDGHAILCAYMTSVSDYLDRSGKLIPMPNAIVALGDGGAHYGLICDAAYTTYFLVERVGRDGITLPLAIKALSSQPAQSLGLNDRGVIGLGYKADLNVIDLDRLTLRRPRIERDLPAGGKRLRQASSGYVATIVSGVVTRREDEPTGKLPGRLIRGTKQSPVASGEPLAV